MKLHRGAADLLAQLAHRQGRPVTVTFQVTDRCNYECVHCYQEHTKHDELSFAEIERILRELADAGVLFLTLMGGEFFMRRDADDILRTAHELGFALKLLTTGHHVHDKRADLIADMRPIQVDLSLYAATPHVHEAVTRHPGSWQRTYDAARRLIARKVPVLLKAPVMEINVADLANLAAMAREIGAESSFDAKVTGMETPTSNRCPCACAKPPCTRSTATSPTVWPNFGQNLRRLRPVERTPSTTSHPVSRGPASGRDQSARRSLAVQRAAHRVWGFARTVVRGHLVGLGRTGRYSRFALGQTGRV